MIHKKYFQILKLFTGDYNREIYGRELINKINLSQKNIALTLKELEKENILTSKKRGNIKLYKLNIKYKNIKETLKIIETLKKIEFFSKNKKIAHIFNKDDRIIGIFGSYAKGTAKKNSDIDLFTIGKKLKNDYNIKGKKFDLSISIKYFTEKQFKELLNKKNNLLKEIVKNHIILFNTEKFIEYLWSDYYGFN